jgi:hypothetical protein
MHSSQIVQKVDESVCLSSLNFVSESSHWILVKFGILWSTLNIFERIQFRLVWIQYNLYFMWSLNETYRFTENVSTCTNSAHDFNGVIICICSCCLKHLSMRLMFKETKRKLFIILHRVVSSAIGFAELSYICNKWTSRAVTYTK